MSKIKIIHFSDYHLGVETYGSMDPKTKLPGRVLDFLDSLDALIDYAVDNDADLVLFAGDAFHRHSPEPTLLREFGERIVRLAEYCPVVLLVGNHDMPGIWEKATALDVFDTLRVPNVIVGSDYKVHNIDTKNGRIQIATAPYPLMNYFLSVDEKKKSDRIGIMKMKLERTLESLAQEIDQDYPAILLGHFSVNNAIFGSERPMTIGDSAEVDIQSLLHEAWDYVALGHIHYHQDLSTIVQDEDVYIPPIVYAGSLDRVDFSEEKHDKGFIWLEIDNDGASWEFVEIDARPFVTIDIDVIGAKNQTSKIISKIDKQNIKSAIVRLNVKTEEGRSGTINRKAIIKALDEAGVFCIHNISIKEETPHRQFKIDDGVKLTSLTDEEKLRTYFQIIDTPKKEIKSLMSLALEIMEEVNDEING